MISSAVLTKILQQLGQEGGEVEVLKGATSSLVFRVGEGILRVHTNQDWLHEEPDLVLHEVFALQAAGDLAPDVLDYQTDFRDEVPPWLYMTRSPERSGLIRWMSNMSNDWHRCLRQSMRYRYQNLDMSISRMRRTSRSDVDAASGEMASATGGRTGRKSNDPIHSSGFSPGQCVIRNEWNVSYD